MHIPTDPAYPALNLAQAVAICLYELRVAWLRQTDPRPRDAPAPFAQQERMYDNLRKALEEVPFLYGDKADSLMHAVRHLLGRAGPTPKPKWMTAEEYADLPETLTVSSTTR